MTVIENEQAQRAEACYELHPDQSNSPRACILPVGHLGLHDDDAGLRWGSPLKISNSEIQAWKSCKRMWWLTYYRQLGLTAKAAELGARTIGIKVHLALEAMYRDHSNPVEVAQQLYAEDIERFPMQADALYKELDLVRAMLEGFVAWRDETALDANYSVVGVETALEVELPEVEGVVLRGKLDQRVIRTIDGARLFRDWKTVSDLIAPLRMLPLDEQMKFYTLLEYLDALQKTGEGPVERTDGGLYTMLKKSKRTARATPPFYDVAEVRYNMNTLRSMWLRVVAEVREIVAARAALDRGGDHRYYAYPRPSRDCAWRCDFLPVCAMFDEGSNAEGFLNEYYSQVDPNARYNDDEQKRDEL